MLERLEFDLDRFLKNSKRVQVEDLDWDHVPDHPLTNGEVRFLTYMMNIESHTIVYLRDLLGTTAIKEADVTAFLSCWAYEEFFHGYYLERLLKSYVGDANVVNDTGRRLSYGGKVKSGLKRVLTPIVTGAAPDFAATHMTWGAAQEYTTLHGYEAIIRGTKHPVLKELLTRVVKDERRHFAFYYKNAHQRLERSPFMQKETRFFMDRMWRPVGAGAMPEAELDFVAWFLFRDEQGKRDAAEVDATMSRLPGMDGWRGLTKAIDKAVARHERTLAGDGASAYETHAPAARAAA